MARVRLLPVVSAPRLAIAKETDGRMKIEIEPEMACSGSAVHYYLPSTKSVSRHNFCLSAFHITNPNHTVTCKRELPTRDIRFV